LNDIQNSIDKKIIRLLTEPAIT